MQIGMLVFPRITATDYVAPADLLARIPGARLDLLWKTTAPLATELGWQIAATRSFADCPPLDMLVVPGGPGITELLTDDETLGFLAARGAEAKWIAGVCTGPLVLGAAGLLDGFRATCHWASHDLLAEVGAIPVNERVVVDRNRVTSAGVTSGIDCALRLIALAAGDDAARGIQLFAEYDPQPPFASGTPAKAPAHIVEPMRKMLGPLIESRRAALARRRRVS